MAARFEVVTCLVLLVTTLVGASTAATHNVGDDLGWQVPKGGAVQYEAWASKTDIEVGDTIEFKWTGKGSVAQVSKADFNDCTLSKIISPVQLSSPASYTINSTDTEYFINNNGTNCKSGQKVAITAKKVGSSTGASAPSLLMGAVSTVFLALAVTLSSHM